MVVLEGKLSLLQWMGLRELNRTQLAEKSGVTLDTIRKFIDEPNTMNNANYSTLKKLAEALEIRVGDFKELG